jgi:eukaryotic-like serine/threonine-protein kinase
MLYEMLSGRRAFEGQSRADTMTAILTKDPQPLPDADPHIAPSVARIVDRCLEKNPAARFQSTHDLGFALEGLSTDSGVSGAAPASRHRLPAWLRWALAAASLVAFAVTAALAIASYRRPRDTALPVRFLLAPPGTSATFSATSNFLSVSPDGRHLAFVGANAAGTPVIWVRPIDSLEARPLAGTDGAREPFWSPDGRYVGFFTFGRLKKIAISGGPPQTLTEAVNIPTGGTWSRDGVILFSNLAGAIRQVSASGGVVSPATALDSVRQNAVHSFPHFLPDGRRFLFYIRSPNPEQNGIHVKSLDSDDVRRVVDASSTVAYVAPGYLVYARDGVLLAQPFDAERVVTTGDPVPIAERVDQFPETGIAAFSASETGVLAFRSSLDAALSRLVWFDRRGRKVGEVGEARPYRNPRLSPDGTRVAVELVDQSGNRDIWLMDVARGVPVRFTFGTGRDASPVWSADGQTIAWQGNSAMYTKPSSGAGPEERLRNEPWIPDDWLPDGSGLLSHPSAPRQILLMPVVGADRTPRPVVEGRDITTHARVSSDGRWVAFTSADSGVLEVYVQNFPTPAGRWQVSTNGGLQPKWRRDGKELFYLGMDSMLMSVPVTLGSLAEVGKPQPLFQTRVEPATGVIWHQYDLSPDGQRFLVNTPEAVSSPVTVFLNWPAVLKQ